MQKNKESYEILLKINSDLQELDQLFDEVCDKTKDSWYTGCDECPINSKDTVNWGCHNFRSMIKDRQKRVENYIKSFNQGNKI